MFHHVRRLCSPALIGAALVAPAFGQQSHVDEAQLLFQDGNEQPLPTSLLTIRTPEGRVALPSTEANGSFVLKDLPRKITVDLASKTAKVSSFDIILLDAPRVFLRMTVDPATGEVKEIYQKPVALNFNPNHHVRQAPRGRVGLGGPPANDDCATPDPIGVGVTAIDTTAATGSSPGCGSGGSLWNEIWYDFTAPGNGTLTLSTCNNAGYDTQLAVYGGLACPVGAPLACNDDFIGCAGFTSEVSAAVVGGQHYLIGVGGFGSSSRGTGTLTVSFEGVGGGLPDVCADAMPIDCDSSVTINNTGAMHDPSDPDFSCHFGGAAPGVNDIWFSFVAAGNAVELDTSNSAVSDTLMALFDGSCGALVELACDDDAGVGFRSLINYGSLTPGNTYYVQVASYSAGSIGSITLDISCPVGPVGGDDCANAITVACGGTASVNNSGFTTDPGDPIYSCHFGAPAQGVGTAWFKFTATATSALIDTNLSGVADTLLAAYDGTCGAFTEIACSDDDGIGLLSSFCVEGLVPGNVYYIQAASYSVASLGDITVSVQCPCPTAPDNDDCSNAEALVLPASVVFDNSFATDDIAVPCGVASGPFKNVWYSVAGTGNTITATTCNAGTIVDDTKISVFCADCGELVCVGGNDDDCDAFQIFSSTVSWCSQVGANYFVTVGNFSSSTAPGVIQLDVFDSGSPCVAEVVCLPQGACCLPDGSCVITTADDCAGRDGTYQGDGSFCNFNSVADGGFENGAFSGDWNEASTNFGTPLCDSGCGTGGSATPTHGGSWWCWFGGIGAFEAGSVDQDVVIAADATTLDFWLEIPVSSGNGVDYMRVWIDGNLEFEVLEDDPMYANDGYDLVSIPLGAYADGGMHNIQFESTITGAGGMFTNFFVDDVSVNSVATECPQPIDCFVLNFDTDDEGNAMPHGAHVDTEFDGGSVFPVTITGVEASSSLNTLAILNSTTGPAAQDPDLLVGTGNILILQTDSNLTECPPASGIYCTHNDDDDGGSMSFAFNQGTSPSSIDLIDVDGTDGDWSVVLTDGSGNTRTYSVPANWTGDLSSDGPPGYGTLDLTTLADQAGFGSNATATEDAGFDPDNVVQIDVNLGGSGGVDNLSWCQSSL